MLQYGLVRSACKCMKIITEMEHRLLEQAGNCVSFGSKQYAEPIALQKFIGNKVATIMVPDP